MLMYYETSFDNTTSAPTPAIIENDEFAQFVSGQRTEVSDEVRGNIKQIMVNSKAKTDLFFAAYAQKGMSRLARVMTFLDKVDGELFTQDWRLKALTTEDLLSLYKEVSADKSRSSKELIDIVERFDGEAGYNKVLRGKEIESTSTTSKLSKTSRAKVTAFYKSKIISPEKK